MNIRLFHIPFLLLSVLNFCMLNNSLKKEEFTPNMFHTFDAQDSTIHYLALGDSYSAGTGVRMEKSFPIQLANCLQKQTKKKILTQVIAKAGWRTDELKDSLTSSTALSSYDLVTLWIGVNNHYQKKPFSKFKKEFPKLLARAIKLAKGNASHVFVISIPDWGFTPFGEKDGRKNISKEINKYNDFVSSQAKEQGASYVSIVDLSRESIRDANLVAKDGLHPSGLAYQGFVERVCPSIIAIVN